MGRNAHAFNCDKGKVGNLSSIGSIKSKRKIATVAVASQMAGQSDFAKRQEKFPVMVKSKHVGLYTSSTGKKLKTVNRRSQRIMSLGKPAENQNKPQVCELDNSGGEIEVELGAQIQDKSAEPSIKLGGWADGDTKKEREEKARKVKKTQKVISNPQQLNGDFAPDLPEDARLVNIAEQTQEMDKAPVKAKTKHASKSSAGKKMQTVTRRSQRITNMAKPAENQNNEPWVCDLDDNGTETDVEPGVQTIKGRAAEPVIKPRVSAGGDGEKEERVRKVKKTQQVVSKPQGLNDGVTAGRTVDEQRVNDAEKTQEVVTKPLGLNDGASAAGSEEEQQVNGASKTQEEVVDESAERSSSQNASNRKSRYRALYIKSMRRLDALTEERNSLYRQLDWAQAKLGVLHDFRDQISELTEKLDIANERLEVYQKTMNPQMVDMLTDFLTSTNQSQTAEVLQKTSSEKDVGMHRSTKPCRRRSKKRKAPLK